MVDKEGARLSYVIRPLASGDYPALVELWERAGLDYRPRGRDSAAEFRRQLALPNIRFLGARDVESGRLLGSILATHDGRKGWLNRLAVEPAERRRGLAGRLIEAAEEWLLGEGTAIIACLIEEWNDTSHEVFRHYGYVDFPGMRYLTKRRDDDV